MREIEVRRFWAMKEENKKFKKFKKTDSKGRSPEDYLLANPEWKLDTIPEIMDGKNIADFIDPDIAEKLETPERGEEKLQAEGFYDSESDIVCAFKFVRLLYHFN